MQNAGTSRSSSEEKAQDGLHERTGSTHLLVAQMSLYVLALGKSVFKGEFNAPKLAVCFSSSGTCVIKDITPSFGSELSSTASSGP